MGLGVRAVANERRKKKSPSRGHSFSLSSRPLVCAFPFFVSGTVPKDLDPSLLSLSTVSLLLSKRRRDRRDPIQARDDPELASQTKKRQSIVSSSSHQAKEKKTKTTMGRFFSVEFDSQRVYCCASCGTSLAPAESLVSKVSRDRDERENERGRMRKRRTRSFLFLRPSQRRESVESRRHAEATERLSLSQPPTSPSSTFFI